MLFLNAKAQEPLQAGIKYNEASARIEVFKDISKKLEKDFYSKYKKDLNRDENIALIKKNIFEAPQRKICPFYLRKTLASYALIYDEMPNCAFYYNVLGNLIKVDITQGNDFPKKILGYSRFGNLISATLETNEAEQFVYDENGKLIAHWLGDEMFDKNGKNPRFIKLKRGN